MYNIKNWFNCLLIHSVILLVDSAARIERNPLTESILHYETLNYAKEYLIHNHNRVRRSFNPIEELHLNFKAHNRLFNVRLRRNIEIFSSDAKFGEYDGFRPENIYAGYLADDPSSKVHGFIHDDIFEGRIITGDGNEFYIESSKQYKHLNSSEHHSVIYNVKDILFPEPHLCGGIRPNTQEYMNKELNRTVWKDVEDKDEYIKYSNNDESSYNQPHQRQRRATFDPNKKECRLFIRADHTFVTYATSPDRAMYIITQLVESTKYVYERTDFDGTGKAQMYSIKIERIDAMSKDACATKPSSTECQFVAENIGVEKFLDLASLDNHNQFCLSFVIAHRDFNDGVLGLAWIGDRTGAGGICDQYQMISGQMKSLNSGIVTNLNYGKTVPTKVTEITLAHEIGHNFGAQHDSADNAACAPGGSAGNFIMFPRATSGSDPNNYNFSLCSKNYIWPVIQAKSGVCFKVRGDPICGNRIVEAGEDCDCGYVNEQSCLMDPCCTPADNTGGGCKYKINVINRCSPSNGFCCNPRTCQPYTDRRVCSNATDCAAAAMCTTSAAACPTATTIPNVVKKKCNNNQAVCVDGHCTGSLCLAEPVNNYACQCKTESDLCKVCCQQGNNSDTCQPLGNLYLPPGSPCDNYNGYCDILSKCRKVDAEGPLSRLKNWLFSSKTFSNILDWMKEYWWACVLIALGIVLFMAGFIACCSVHTPSSNPNKPKPRQMTLPRSFSRRGADNPSAPPYHQQYQNDAPPGYDTAIRGGRPNYPDSVEMR